MPRNIDSITKQVVLSNHYVADVDPHAIYHLVTFWDIFAHCRHPILHFHCALGRINGTGKLDYDAVTRGAKNLAIVLSDHAIENLATFSQHPQGVFFIRSHHLAEADHIGRQYRAVFVPYLPSSFSTGADQPARETKPLIFD